MKVTEMQRSRLKLTIAGMICIGLIFSVPIIVIFRAAEIGVFEVNAPWIFFGTAVTAFGGIVGYYVNRETHRPSLMNTTIFGDYAASREPDGLMHGEDESDPENIPL